MLLFVGYRLSKIDQLLKLFNGNSNFRCRNLFSYQPLLKKFIDAATVSVNSKATPSAIGTITGSCLQCDVTDLEQGVFFMPVNKPGTQIRAMIYSRIFPKELSFNIPALDAGEYRVLVKSKPKTDILSSLLKETITVE